MKLLKFKADWCGPCSTQEEILEDFDVVPVKTIDIEDSPDTATEYGVQSIPTLILEDDGEVVKRWRGVTQLDQIEKTIRNN